MKKALNLTFASSLSKLCEINSSFDAGILRIAYPGTNRNGSHIAKSTFEKCIDSIYNCPVVCNYDRDSDSLGGHDMEIVTGKDGDVRLVNLTTPVGVIPESSHWFWSEVEEDDGTIREYLCAEVILWKRQEAYQKIKSDGIVEQSMEITVKDGKVIDGIYHITDFEFTAFALIGVEPCFESASLETFSKKEFKQQLFEMMQELKESYEDVATFNMVNDINKISMEGGKMTLDEKMKLAAEYGIDIESLDFSIEELSIEELKEKFEAMVDTSEETKKDVMPEEIVDPAKSEKPEEAVAEPSTDFELQSNVTEEIIRGLEAEKVQREWGETSRYWYVDHDAEAHEVYCWDTEDWLLYGFAYENNGDNIDIKFDSKKRMKFAIVDFDEGEQPSPIANAFTNLSEALIEYAKREETYKLECKKLTELEEEVSELREFKARADKELAKEERDEIFEQFTDLIGDETFEKLREDCMDYELEALEEKCYAIRGRKNVASKFSIENKTTKLKVDKTANATEDTKEPYGGLFIKYGVGENI